jgi:hypothetical protein
MAAAPKMTPKQKPMGSAGASQPNDNMGMKPMMDAAVKAAEMHKAG